MGWIYLLLAGLLEIVWATGLKLSDGFSRPLATAVTIVALIASLTLLGLALRTLPVGTGYAIWTGIGAVGAAIVGIVHFGELVTVWRIVSILIIILGIAGLKLTS